MTDIKELQKEKALKTQTKLLLQIQSKGFNIVNCGQCGDVFIHRANLVRITCPYCRLTSEPCDFPDFFYQN